MSLAAVYCALGQPEAALLLDQRALQITETALGPSHPDVAIRLEFLAATYRALGQTVQAPAFQQQASRLRKPPE
jgi:hypothetical protein